MGRPRQFRIGTTGWNYPDWVGPFYPQDAEPGSFLAHYSTRFDLVEVDSTAKQAPKGSQIDDWRQATPRGFQFTCKVPRVITHEKVLLGCRDDFREFVETVHGLGNKLLCVLLQFGNFTKQAFPSAKDFYERVAQFLDAAGDAVPIAVEIRNKTWLTEEWFDLLREHKAAAVLVEHPWMPPVADLIERFDVATGPVVYVRLIGDPEGMEKKTQHWDRVVIDRTKELEGLAAALLPLAETSDVAVLANNHYAGHAPATAEQFASLIGLHSR